ncbi:hypothetical protein [Paenibacillus sp. Marseille-Q4541]|uniref:hypothetical protein n=1 Tax=Paenibacillus sp. Marseille-Q4541 TaxID=2831522 RepID=UPI001BAA0F61|nr:hypothetical protein [Paenibacillus sp. Marseille-Q4541]
MKYATRFCYVLVLFLILNTSMSTAVTAAPVDSNQEEALQIANAYLDALQNNDVDRMMRYSYDLNYINEESRREGYNRFATDSLDHYRVESISKVDDQEYEIEVQYTYTDVQSYPLIPYTVLNTNDGWKVIIKPLEVNLNPDSSEYMSIKDGVPVYQMTPDEGKLFAAPRAAVAYYSFDLQSSTPLLGSSSFNITQGTVTINGYQSDRVSSSKASVKYEIVKPLSSGAVNWYGQKTIAGSYPQNGSWYSSQISLSASPITDARVRITNLSYDVYGAGNVYE